MHTLIGWKSALYESIKYADDTLFHFENKGFFWKLESNTWGI